MFSISVLMKRYMYCPFFIEITSSKTTLMAWVYGTSFHHCRL